MIYNQVEVFKILQRFTDDMNKIDSHHNNLAHLSVIRCSNEVTIELMNYLYLFDHKNKVYEIF